MVARLRDAILADTRANQPLATAVAIGTLYYVTDEDVLERSDGSAWTETAINTTAHAAIDHTGLPGVGAGGSGVPFAANLPEDVGTMARSAITKTDFNVGVANRCHFFPFMPKYGETVSAAYFRVTSATGNMDIGIYDAALTLLVSTGSFAVPAAGSAARAFAASATQALTAGSLYYIGMSASSASATFYGSAAALVSAITTGRTSNAHSGAYAYLNSTFPLPAGPVTPTGFDPGISMMAVYLA
jgi:hypothetical protein